MASAEIPFEYLAAALEATRGTAVTPPTHYLPLVGSLKPTQSFFRPDESVGSLEEYTRSKVVRRGAEWSGEGGADPNYAPFLFNMAVKGVTSPSTPSGATNTRLWTFVPTQNADDLKTATLFFGDPNAQIFRSTYAYINQFSIDSGDATSEDGATWSFSGGGKFPTEPAAPTLPALAQGSLLTPGQMQVWVDTSSAIGTTLITDRVVSANLSVSKNISEKFFAAGPTTDLSFSRLGRGKFHPESTVVFEFADLTQYNLWKAAGVIKMRVRLNGDLIETTAGPVDWYQYIQWDIYGTFDSFDWGETAGTNRTISVTVMGQRDATLGASWALYAQNAKTTI